MLRWAYLKKYFFKEENHFKRELLSLSAFFERKPKPETRAAIIMRSIRFWVGRSRGDDSLFDNPLLLPIHLTHAHKIKRLTIFLLFLFYTFSIFLKRSFDKISGKREKQGACKKLWPAVTFCNISCATCAYFRRLMDTEVFAVLQF